MAVNGTAVGFVEANDMDGVTLVELAETEVEDATDEEEEGVTLEDGP
jgi:hypothetical protein